MTSADVSAQSTEAKRYKGNEYTSVKSTDDNPVVVFLYNVGTGKLLISGGDWGVQARLFYEGLGAGLNLVQNNGRWVFRTGVQTADSQTGTGADVFGCNVEGVTANSADIKQPIMDANENYKGYASGQAAKYRNMVFTRVEAASNTETYTYYLSEVLDDKTYYIGAAYGNTYAYRTSWDGTKTIYLADEDASVGDDECAYTTLDVTSSTYAAKNYTIFSSTNVSLQELYQWRLVTLKDIEDAIDSQEITDGLATNVSYRIYDQDFSRNVWSFFDRWQVRQKPEFDYGTEGEDRYAFTFGFETTGTNDQGATVGVQHQDNEYRKDEPWNYPVRLKEQWNSLKSAKYGFMSFEGVGTVSSFITPPAAGLYQVTCKGFYQGSHPGYLFADCVGDPVSASTTNKVNFVESSTTYSKDNGTEDLTSGTWGAGYALTRDANGAYDKTVYVTVTEEDIAAGRKIYFGVGKDDATKSSEDASTGGTTTTYCYITYTSGETTYYLNHNARFVAVDGEPTSDYQWLLQRYNNYSDYYYVYYMNNNSQTWLVTSSNSASTSTSTSNRLYYYNGSIVDDRNNDYYTYYLKGTTSSTTAPSVTRGTSGAATARTETVTSGGTSYYHDTDWVAADNFQILYLGKDPVLFDEDEESFDYLKKDANGNVLEFKQYNNQSIRLKREFITGDWNTFVFPLNLTAAQMRGAFGDKMLLAKLIDLGEVTRRADCIDFQIVDLPASGVAVEGGKLYLIKPVTAPTNYTSPDGSESYSFYNLGRATFNTSDFQGIQKVHYGVAEGDDILYRDENRNGVTTFACYYRTSGYGQISGNTVTNPSAIENGVYVPKHSYVIGQNAEKNQAAMYWIKNNMKVKGFRGWLVDGDKTGSQNGAKFYLGGIYDDNGEISGIGFQPMEGNAAKMISNGVYDLSGRKVATSAEQMETLPKGMYIVNGKKYIVK